MGSVENNYAVGEGTPIVTSLRQRNPLIYPEEITLLFGRFVFDHHDQVVEFAEYPLGKSFDYPVDFKLEFVSPHVTFVTTSLKSS